MSDQALRRRLLSSTGGATLSQFARVGVTFLTQLVVRRLIAPADWGVWGWTETVFFVLASARDLGLNGQMVRDRIKPFGNYAVIQLVFGGFMSLATVIFAPWLASLYADTGPQVVAVIRALSLYLFFDGLAKVPIVWFESEIAVGRAVVPEIVRNLCFSAIAIGLALGNFGVWSLVVAHVAATMVFALLVWIRAWKRIPLGWVSGVTGPLLRAALPLAATSILAFLVQYIDTLLLGARFASDVVGNYLFAYTTTFLVARILIPAFGRSIYPAFVAYAREPKKAFETYRLGTIALIAFEAPAAFFLYVNADLVLRILGGGQWTEAGEFLRVLAFAPLAEPWSRFGGELLLSRNRDRLWTLASLLSVLSFLGFGILLTTRMGAVGMAWANFVPLGGLVYAYGVREADRAGFRGLIGDLLLLYVVPALLVLPVAFLATGESARVLLSVGAIGLVAGIYYARFGRRFRMFFQPAA